MEYFEFVRTAFLVVGFLLAMSRDRATWMTVDLLISVVMGAAWVLIPQVLLNFRTEGELTGHHLVICRFFGAVMLTGAFKWYLNYKSHDAYSQVMLMGAKIVGASVILISAIHVTFGPSLEVAGSDTPKVAKGEKASTAKTSKGVVFSDQGTDIAFTMLIGGLLGNLVWFLKAQHYGGHTSLDSRLNMHLRIDFFITLMAGITMLAYTPTILGLKGLKSPDEVQINTLEIIGAFLIGDAILSAVAPGFLFEDDKRNILLGRFAMLGSFLLVILHAIITYEEYHEKEVWIKVIIGGVWLGNTLLGYYSPHETDAYRRKFDKDDD